LKAATVQRYLETSGAYPLTGEWEWICVSPKKFKAPLPEVVARANELKVVVFNQSDFEWAEKYAALANEECRLYLQPEYGKLDTIMPAIISYLRQHPRWTLSLQTHKVINVP
jgi:organic radical activating enzyme